MRVNGSTKYYICVYSSLKLPIGVQITDWRDPNGSWKNAMLFHSISDAAIGLTCLG